MPGFQVQHSWLKSLASKIVLSLIILFFCMKVIGQPKFQGNDSLIYAKLMKMDFNDYVDSTASIFFKDLGYTFTSVIPTSRKPGFIHRVLFVFSDSVSLEIRVKNLGQKGKLGIEYIFNTDVFLSKKIEWICFKYAGECIKGCEELYCD
jgi:hypothetical protein